MSKRGVYELVTLCIGFEQKSISLNQKSLPHKQQDAVYERDFRYGVLQIKSIALQIAAQSVKTCTGFRVGFG
jgi:hypothetical protein